MTRWLVRFWVLAGLGVPLALLLPGCPDPGEDGCGGLVEGQNYEVELQILDGGVLYAVEAEEEEAEDEEGDTDEQEDDTDSDEAEDGEDDDGEYEVTAQVTAVAEDLSSFELLGALTVVPEPDAEFGFAQEDLVVGLWVEVEGDFENGVFEGDEIALADEQEIEISGVLLDLTGTSFTMAGLTITYDDQTGIECEDGDDDDDDEDDDEEDDGED